MLRNVTNNESEYKSIMELHNTGVTPKKSLSEKALLVNTYMSRYSQVCE